MNMNYGYQLSQTERRMTRRELIAGDAQRGRQAATAARTCRRLTRRARVSGTITINAITRLAARATRFQEERA